jgi:hypothetical protein
MGNAALLLRGFFFSNLDFIFANFFSRFHSSRMEAVTEYREVGGAQRPVLRAMETKNWKCAEHARFMQAVNFLYSR